MPKRRSNQQPLDDDKVAYRAGMPKSADDENRTLGLTLATESPVRVYDWSRGEVVDEVLLMSGLKVPRQMPMLNSHSRFNVRDVLGSIRDLSKTDGELTGTAHFASSEDGQSAYQLYKEGHATDFSIGFEIVRSEFVERGATKKFSGKEIIGPARVITNSRAFEGSAVPIGADAAAKARSRSLLAYLAPDDARNDAMDEFFRDIMITLGMPQDHADPKAWHAEYLIRQAAPPLPTHPAPTPLPVIDHAAIERKRCQDIVRLCRKHSVPEVDEQRWLDAGTAIEKVAVEILETVRQKPGKEPIGIQPEESEVDKFCDAISDGVLTRAASNRFDLPGSRHRAAAYGDYDAVERIDSLAARLAKPAVGARDFRYASVSDIARAFCERSGIRTNNLPKQEIIRKALRLQPLRGERAAYHTTGSFANVLLDASNKTLLAGYDEAMVTYPIWARMAASAPDFKNLNRIRFGELADPEVVPENANYPEKGASNSKETYSIDKVGAIFSISFETMVNDDLDAFSRIPAMQGNSMRRKINRSVYAVLTANEALSDGIALFHATSHGANLDATALSATAVNVAYQIMMTQAGLQSGTILNIMPRYLIVPAALSSTALQIVNSTADPTASQAGVANLYGPGGPRQLVVVTDGQLDGNSATAWYCAADSRQVDTVEYTFLQGEESPVMEQEDGFENDCIKFKVRQSYACKAIDYRGLYQGNS